LIYVTLDAVRKKMNILPKIKVLLEVYMQRFEYVVYKLTFPNGKIYIGKDIGGSGHSLRYFGSWNNALVEADYTDEELHDFTIRKEILFESLNKKEVSKKEIELIIQYKSNNPCIGYNRNPKFINEGQ